MASLAEINVLLDAAVTSIGVSNWTTAKIQLMQAAVLIAGRPDGGKADLQLRYQRDAIQRMIDQVNRELSRDPAAGGGGGLVQTPVTYQNPTTTRQHNV